MSANTGPKPNRGWETTPTDLAAQEMHALLADGKAAAEASAGAQASFRRTVEAAIHSGASLADDDELPSEIAEEDVPSDDNGSTDQSEVPSWDPKIDLQWKGHPPSRGLNAGLNRF